MPDTVVVAVLSLLGTLIGSFGGTQLIKYRIEQLEKKVEKHNSVVERTYLLEEKIKVANHRIDDLERDEFIKKHCEELGCEFALSNVWADGGAGGIELADKVLASFDKKSNFKPLYEDELPLEDKIMTIAKEIYGADGVTYDSKAKKELDHITQMGFGNLPVCMAKTQYSLSDDASKLGRPEGFTINIREVYVDAGAGFVVALTGKVLTMPGLPKVPAAEGIDYDEENEKITGLF